jgi:hypothetical protein
MAERTGERKVKTNSEQQSDSDIEAADKECLGACFAYSCYCCTYILMFCSGRNTDDIDR